MGDAPRSAPTPETREVLWSTSTPAPRFVPPREVEGEVATSPIRTPWIYDRDRDRRKTPAVQAHRHCDGWFVVRLAGYGMVSRSPAPNREQAEIEATRIAQEEGIALLPPRGGLTAAEVGADDDGGAE